MATGRIQMYGTTWCGDCKRAKKFFGEHRVPYDFIDVDEDFDGLRVVEEANRGKRVIPMNYTLCRFLPQWGLNHRGASLGRLPLSQR